MVKGKAKGARRVLLRHGRPPANTGLIFALAVKHAGLVKHWVRPRYRDKAEMNEPGKQTQAEAAGTAPEEVTDGVGTTRQEDGNLEVSITGTGER